MRPLHPASYKLIQSARRWGLRALMSTVAVALLACADATAPYEPVFDVQPDSLDLAVGETAPVDVTTDNANAALDLRFQCWDGGSWSGNPADCAVKAAWVDREGPVFRFTITGLKAGYALLFVRSIGEGRCVDPPLCMMRETVVLASERVAVTVR